MAAIAWSDVTNFAADLSAVPVAAQEAILAWVNTTLKTEDFGGETAPKLRLARIFLAAHFGAMQVSGLTGPVTSMSADGVSESFGSMASEEMLGQTQYGVQFTFLVRTSPARVPVVL